ncbi:MAG: YciI family protein [Kofleriaceae bacterium]|nr:YciI family protein [Kofleriaceae bacterium]
MRVLMSYMGDDRSPPSPEKMAAIATFSEEMARSGVVLESGGFLPLSQGAVVKQDKGKVTVTDGPFPETKELIVGYAIVQVKSKEEAVELSRRFMAVAGDGLGQLQIMYGSHETPLHH